MGKVIIYNTHFGAMVVRFAPKENASALKLNTCIFRWLSLEESNLHNQNQNLVHYHYAKGQSLQRKIGTAKIYIFCKRAK